MKFMLAFTFLVSLSSFSAFAAQPCSQAQTKTICDKFLAGCDLSQAHSCGCEVHDNTPMIKGGSHCTYPDGTIKTPGKPRGEVKKPVKK
jgi:hypothetical protein